MKAVVLDDFIKCAEKLPGNVQRQVTHALSLWRQDPLYKSLQFKQAKTKDPVWSIRIGRQYRALALREADTVKWFWVGPHDEYMKLLNRL